MTRDEHIDIRAFIGSVVAGDQAPMDVEADAIIRALFVRNPDAAYRMTMLALALANAQSLAAPRLSAPIRPKARRRRRALWISALFGRRNGRRQPHDALRT